MLICTPYDVEARLGAKRRTTWTGYKVHVTETCDVDTPHLITHIETTPAPAYDGSVVPPIHADLAAQQLLPAAHLADSNYVDAGQLVRSAADYGVELVGPVAQDTSWQARTAGALTLEQFVIDWEGQQVTCPQGATSQQWRETTTESGAAVIRVTFRAQDCQACPLRGRCTRSAQHGRRLTLRPQAEHVALQAARVRQTTAAFKAQYAARAGAEGTLSQGVRAFGLRRARYLGQAKTHLQHVLTAVAMNLARLATWWNGTPQARTRQARFARLAALSPPHYQVGGA